MGFGSWGRYVPVAERRAKAAAHIKKSEKSGKACNPVVIAGRAIAKTFWGKQWCTHLESYSDFANRLPRGRTYVRNGSVIDLQISKGKIVAQVMGSSLYHVAITVKPMLEKKWKSLVGACSGKIDSLIELLQGKFSQSVMKIITEKETGLFPKPQEINMDCSCPDVASMCKHVAAVLYGVGACLDTKPEWLFDLRHVNHVDLLESAQSDALATPAETEFALANNALAEMFGIDLDALEDAPKAKSTKKPAKATKKEVKKEVKKDVKNLAKKPVKSAKKTAKTAKKF